jgi:hypothetical protein
VNRNMSNTKAHFSAVKTQAHRTDHYSYFVKILIYYGGPLMVGQWLRYCVTNRKVAGSIPDGVNGIFH